MPTPIHSVKFWINAFIPRDVSGYTKPVPGGPHRGKTMIPGPNPVSDCYLTDQRDFSNDIHAKSRMHSEFRMALDPIRQGSQSGTTATRPRSWTARTGTWKVPPEAVRHGCVLPSSQRG